MKAYHKGCILACASFAAIASATAAEAQDTGGDIIVTARRSEERLQDVPISITVYNQQQLTNRNVFTGEGLARYTPSLSTNSNEGSDNTTFALRGFVQDTGTAPSVGVYLADVVAPRGAANGLAVGDGAGPGSFLDLQNVQVLKGPQGTLFGRNTTGGAILLVPQKPTSRFEGYIEGTYGNYGEKRGTGAINVPVLDNLRIRLAVDHQSRDGYLKNVSGVGPRDFNDIDYTALRFSAVADLTPNLENYTIVSYSKSNNHGTFQKIIAADTNLANGFASFAQAQMARDASGGFYTGEQDLTPTFSRLEQWQVINTTTWKSSDTLTIKNIASYAQLTDGLAVPLFGTHFLAGPFAVDFANSNPPANGYTSAQYTLTDELQAQGSLMDGRLTYQTGAYLESSRPLEPSGSQSSSFAACSSLYAPTCSNLPIPGFPGAVINHNIAETDFHDIGLYAQATYKLTDKLKVTGGIRYTWDHERVNEVLYSLGGFPTIPLSGGPTNFTCTNPLSNAALPVGGRSSTQPLSALNNDSCRLILKQHSNAPTWTADLDYTPTQDLLFYGKYSRGYRAGVIDPDLVGQFNYVKAEKVDTYEIGAKTSFHGQVHGNLNVAGFYNNFSNQQTQLGFSSLFVAPAAGPVNLGKSRIWGIEVEGNVTFLKYFTIDGGYTHLDTKIKSIKNYAALDTYPYILEGIPLVGDPLALSPKNKYTVTGTIALPLDPSVGKVSVSATSTHTDKMLANYNNKLFTGSAATTNLAYLQSLSYLQKTDLLNMNISWNSIFGTKIDVSGFVTNMTNKHYYTYIPGLVSSAGFEVANIGEPRMYGARVKYHF